MTSIASSNCKSKSSRASQRMAKKLLAEFLGTFCLVFAGTGAIVIDTVTGGAVSHVGVALTFGLVVLAMIYTIGDISGAHINPAVTRRSSADPNSASGLCTTAASSGWENSRPSAAPICATSLAVPSRSSRAISEA